MHLLARVVKAVAVCLVFVAIITVRLPGQAAGPQTDSQGVSRVGGGFSAPRLIHKVDPTYSDEALKAKLEGTVELNVKVEPDGHAHDITVRKGLGMGLDEKAVEAVRQWTFRPGTQDGQTLAVGALITVHFRLPAGPTPPATPQAQSDTAIGARQKASDDHSREYKRRQSEAEDCWKSVKTPEQYTEEQNTKLQAQRDSSLEQWAKTELLKTPEMRTEEKYRQKVQQIFGFDVSKPLSSMQRSTLGLYEYNQQQEAARHQVPYKSLRQQSSDEALKEYQAVAAQAAHLEAQMSAERQSDAINAGSLGQAQYQAAVAKCTALDNAALAPAARSVPTPSATTRARPPLRTGPAAPGDYFGVGSGHWIEEVSGNGSIVALEDGSLWQINAVDRVTTLLWLPVTDITVRPARRPVSDYRFVLVNTEDGEQALARYLGSQ